MVAAGAVAAASAHSTSNGAHHAHMGEKGGPKYRCIHDAMEDGIASSSINMTRHAFQEYGHGRRCVLNA